VNDIFIFLMLLTDSCSFHGTLSVRIT